MGPGRRRCAIVGTLGPLIVGCALLRLAGVALAGAPPVAPGLTIDLGADVQVFGGDGIDDSGDIWAGYSGGLARLVRRSDGGLQVSGRVALAPDASPSAIEELDDGVDVDGRQASALAVADRSSNAVLILVQDPDGGYQVVQRIPVGIDPVAMAQGQFDRDSRTDLVVADHGSDDVSVLLDVDAVHMPGVRRIAAGAGPTAVALLDAVGDTAGRLDLAVADGAANAVTVMRGDRRGGFVAPQQVPVGADPSALLSLDFLGTFNLFGGATLVSANAGDGTLSVVLIGPKRIHGVSTLPIPGAAGGHLAALAAGSLFRDGWTDLAVADSARGTVTILRSDRAGRLHLQPPVMVGGHPSAVMLGDVAGDRLDDVIVNRPPVGSVSVAIVPGDRVLAPGASAVQLTGGGGWLVWSSRRPGGGWRLRSWHDGVVSDLPLPGSPGPIRARFGRSVDGRPLVSYGRCADGRCGAYAFDLRAGRERRLQVRVPAGCRAVRVSVWRGARAYWLHSRRSARCRRRGAWIAWPGRRPRRIRDPGLLALGDVRVDRVGWIDWQPQPHHHDRLRVRVMSRSGRMRTLTRSERCAYFCVGGDGPWFDGATAYALYVYVADTGETALDLVRVSRGCSARWPGDDTGLHGVPAHNHEFESWGDAAVVHGRVYYTDGRSVFQADPKRIRWVGSACR